MFVLLPAGDQPEKAKYAHLANHTRCPTSHSFPRPMAHLKPPCCHQRACLLLCLPSNLCQNASGSDWLSCYCKLGVAFACCHLVFAYIHGRLDLKKKIRYINPATQHLLWFQRIHTEEEEAKLSFVWVVFLPYSFWNRESTTTFKCPVKGG